MFKVHAPPARNVNAPAQTAGADPACAIGHLKTVPAGQVLSMPTGGEDVMTTPHDKPQIAWPAVQPGDPTEQDVAHKPMRLK